MYRVLYRKWRPQTFSEVYGQQHVTLTLKNELESGKISHAYLFTGTRGTGKTSCAKILAKAINCDSPENGNPCCKCEKCKGIENGSILDVIEIDAASNNGVDNIRDLRDEANYTPVYAKYRVYIIDEVHMLSSGAFNALLKTLEEPPAHVVFILATTEIHKLPATILSRCQRFDFHRISPETISELINVVCKEEKIEIDSEAVFLISRLADGALRDALSLLDRCSSSEETVTAEVVRRAAGLAGKDHLFSLTDCAKNSDYSGALQIIDTLYNNSCDMERLCSELITHYRNLMVIKSVKKPEDILVCFPDELTMYTEQAASFRLEEILSCIEITEKALYSIKEDINKRIIMETTVVKLCSDSSKKDFSSLIKRIELLEEKLSKGNFNITPRTESEKPQPVSVAAVPAAPEEAPAASESENSDGKDVPVTNWAEIIEELKGFDMALVGILHNSNAFFRGDFILIKSSNSAFESFIKTNTHSSALKKAVFNITGKNYRLGIYKTEPADPDIPADPLDNLLNNIENLKNF